MTTTIADTCHCLVRHPDKASFLVVKHEETWSPPVLLFPPGLIDFKVNQINQGMQDKYGLKTRVLRPIVHLPNYHCIEMELISTQPAKKLQAVWVDEAEYQRTRSATGEAPDPFALWFAEQKAVTIPELRPAFHRVGWFDQAEHWIQFQLDRLGIQVTGSVEQFRQGWTSSCLLRAPTNQGWIYFKAGNEPAPGEAMLTAALAERWPHTVAAPLVVDGQRNWMLNRDFREERTRIDVQQLPAFAGALAELQLQSRDDLQRWREIGCRELSLQDFVQVSQQPEEHRNILQRGGGGLTDPEWEKFREALQPISDECRILADINLPQTLVHIDFRDDNLALLDGKQLLLDWNGTMISHPFLALGRVFEDHRATLRQVGHVSTMRINEELYQQIIESYLQPFTALASLQDLLRALEAAEKLDRLWRILRMFHQLETIEPFTPHFYRQVVGAQVRAKRFINRHFS
jgi:hypothetical protein